MLFASGAPGDDYAAFMKRNDSVEQEDEIRGSVEDGYLVRTRADEPTVQARSGDTTLLDAALASGATVGEHRLPGAGHGRAVRQRLRGPAARRGGGAVQPGERAGRLLSTEGRSAEALNKAAEH